MRRFRVRFRVPSFRNGRNTRFGPCTHHAEANASVGLNPGLPRVRTTVDTALILVFRCLGVRSSTHLDTCAHQVGVRVDTELRLALLVCTRRQRQCLFRYSWCLTVRVPSSFRVVCARALMGTRIFHPDMACPVCAQRQEQIWRCCAGSSRSGRLLHLRVHVCTR